MTEQNVSAALGQYQSRVDAALADLKASRVISRIWTHDHTLWKPEPAAISNRLGWLLIAETMKENINRMRALAEDVTFDGCTHALLLGMGGSSLAPEVFRKTFGVRRGFLDLAVLDSTDPGAVLAHANSPHLNRTLFIVSTKSGNTVETLSLFRFFYNHVFYTTGYKFTGDYFIAITDPGSLLDDLADTYDFRSTFLNDPDIGGRYSALSYFGLVPAALVGVDLSAILDRVTAMMRDCRTGAWLGAVMGEMYKAGRDKLTLIISPSIATFGTWVEQFIAESSGKEGKGVLPVDGEAPGAPYVYGDDRFFVYLRLDGDNTYDAAVKALIEAGQPVVQINLRDPYDLGGEFFRWEMATAVAGYLLGINPFDQSDVELSKKLTKDMVSAYKETGALPALEPALKADGITVYGDVSAGSPVGAMKQFLTQARPGDYIAIQAYVQPSEETDAALQRLRIQVRDSLKLATTVGYGPRFLHSTGQLHKGDAGNGLFIQITADDQQDAPIPDEAGSPDSSITFSTLKAAQALGDYNALLKTGRRVIRFHLGEDLPGGLEQLIF